MNIDKIINEKLNLTKDTDLAGTYSDLNIKNSGYKKVKSIINQYMPKIKSCHDKNLELQLKQYGYTILENFFDASEVDNLKKSIEKAEGFNYHIARNSFNRETRSISQMGDWNILSFEPDVLLESNIFLKALTNKKILSLAQSYLGCFPTLYSVNCFNTKYTGEEFKIQTIHRDYDDYKFLTFFIYLNDVDANNGPHVYYKNTHNGSDDISNPIELLGKQGTCLVLDGYGLHHGKPMIEGERLVAWFRLGLSLNKTYYKGELDLFKMHESKIFENIECNLFNKYLLRGFIQDISI